MSYSSIVEHSSDKRETEERNLVGQPSLVPWSSGLGRPTFTGEDAGFESRWDYHNEPGDSG